jgi:hypothetical protein
MKHAAMHRVEDRIRSLCARMVTAEGDEEITLRLKDSLHEYIERLCIRMADYSFVVERRASDGMQPDEPMRNQAGEKHFNV